jgi:hypothetical protein
MNIGRAAAKREVDADKRDRRAAGEEGVMHGI